MRITFEVTATNALEFPCDVLALKYAQAPYGLDKAVLHRLRTETPNIDARLPKPGGFEIFKGAPGIAAKNILMVGVDALPWFRYEEIREFGRRVITSMAEAREPVHHIALTVHGPGYGLDEAEAFASALGGIVESITGGAWPRNLNRISFVELNGPRAARLDLLLGHLLSKKQLDVADPAKPVEDAFPPYKNLDTAGTESAAKPHVFVAMPFDEAMDDTFHYGIQQAAHAAGYLCERADEAAFTGDVMQWVTSRIQTAKLVIADLTTANPNVYLEVGYALGCNVPVVLLNKKGDPVGFDLRGQRRLVYTSIRSLEEILTNELKRL